MSRHGRCDADGCAARATLSVYLAGRHGAWRGKLCWQHYQGLRLAFAAEIVEVAVLPVLRAVDLTASGTKD